LPAAAQAKKNIMNMNKKPRPLALTLLLVGGLWVLNRILRSPKAEQAQALNTPVMPD
jgi:flagellar biogenesis protein FliO